MLISNLVMNKQEINMALTTKTDHKTESDFEASIHGVLLNTFPWLNADSISHQKQFSMKFGHAIVTVKGKEITSKGARLDVLINYEGKPLAIFELKREGVSLNEDDIKQGLSYARMIEVMPPLVIVTNGDDTRIFKSYNGEEFTNSTMQEKHFSAIINSVGKLAADDIKEVLST